jgi:protein-tyrosine phosphatase
MKTISWKPAHSAFREALQRQTRVLASKQFWAGEVGSASRRFSNLGMDITWITGRIALGGGIWTAENMAEVARAGITHIVDMQIEFDDTPLAEVHGIEVLWNPTDDDFQPKEPELFQRGVDFAQSALDDGQAKVFIHCAAGVHRAAMMTLALLCSQGWELGDAMQTISSRRPVVDFADVYVNSVEKFLQQQVRAGD